jgi:hypothetical protein
VLRVCAVLSGYVTNTHRHNLQDEVRFDPTVLLGELYRLDRQLSSLQLGASASRSHSGGDNAPHGAAAAGGAAAGGGGGAASASDPWQQQSRPPAASGRYGADDYEHCESDGSDDDWDDESYHQGLSRTPGRQPPQRHATKHGHSRSGGSSSGAGGGGGQQQQRQQLTPQQRGPIPRWRQPRRRV